MTAVFFALLGPLAGAAPLILVFFRCFWRCYPSSTSTDVVPAFFAGPGFGWIYPRDVKASGSAFRHPGLGRALGRIRVVACFDRWFARRRARLCRSDDQREVREYYGAFGVWYSASFCRGFQIIS